MQFIPCVGKPRGGPAAWHSLLCQVNLLAYMAAYRQFRMGQIDTLQLIHLGSETLDVLHGVKTG